MGFFREPNSMFPSQHDPFQRNTMFLRTGVSAGVRVTSTMNTGRPFVLWPARVTQIWCVEDVPP